MKKTGIRASILAIIIVIAMTSFAFAEGGLTIVESIPKDEGKDVAVENLGVKITFSEPVGGEANQEANSKCFTLTDSEGTAYPTRTFFDPKNPAQILVIYDTTEGNQLSSKSKELLTLTISGSFRSDSGSTLGADQKLTFTTVNTAFNNKVYMFIMMGMMAVMVFMSTRKKKAAADDEDDVNYKEEPFNPYKEAKRTGKSVEEVTRQHNREVARREARAAKRAIAERAEEVIEVEEERKYKVKGPRRISEAGGKFVSGRKK